ncbi:MAG TPA: F0F1 ATP synthase subunit delta [Jatrophihabitantaceae bacterium]|jgi:F-type H+-transporting ATPase subunit delta|nr:F0F1 ATP synthase subunit delta [Jatrophihabitantaceae bacterium]
MQAASRQALAELRERLDGVLGRFSTADGLTGLAGELYEITDVLNNQPQLRRKLADPTTRAERRADLIGGLLEGKVSASALTITREAVALRWSSGWDLLDALEITADDVLLGAAEHAGAIDEVEDELFRFGRVLDSDSRLATLLDDFAAAADRRVALVDQLVAGKVHPLTQQLLDHAVVSQRKRSVTHAIDDLLQLSAARRRRSMARVTSAVLLSAAQERRLADKLSDLYGRPITIRTAIDPSVLGGLVIQVGDEVIDGSVAARLAEVKAALAG